MASPFTGNAPGDTTMEKQASIPRIAPAPPSDGAKGDAASADMRAAPRLTLLIRAAKLVCRGGDFVCILRDVSDTGVSVRMFHKPPECDEFELSMPGGARYVLRPVWTRDREAGFEFAKPVNVEGLLKEAGELPKRGVRLDLCFPARIRTLQGDSDAIVENLSQQGARLESDGLFAIDQTLRIESIENSAPFGEVRAKVRWRRENRYGVVFDDTFSLEDFARFAARVQAPGLLV